MQTMTQLARSLRLDAAQVRATRDAWITPQPGYVPTPDGVYAVIVTGLTTDAADLDALARLTQSAANPIKRARLANSVRP